MSKRIEKSATEPHADACLNEAIASPHRKRILEAALALLTTGGRDALTTRAVAEAAGVQPPVLYRLFHDKRGLLDAVADYGFALYLSDKRQRQATEDPVQFLRDGWDRHVLFGLSRPELYLLMYADPHPAKTESSIPHTHPGLQRHMQGIAASGRLRLPAHRAADAFHAAACGVVMTLLAQPKKNRDLALSRVAREAVLASILFDPPTIPVFTVAAAANTLQAQLLSAEAQPHPALNPFTEPEKALLLEWLARLSQLP